MPYMPYSPKNTLSKSNYNWKNLNKIKKILRLGISLSSFLPSRIMYLYITYCIRRIIYRPSVSVRVCRIIIMIAPDS